METAVGLIVSALVSGAVAGLKPTAEKAVTDAYEGFKGFLQGRFASVNVASLEKKPGSEIQQAAVSESLADSGADRDEEVLRKAQELIQLIQDKAPAAAAEAGITVEKLRSLSSVSIRDLVAEGPIRVEGIRAGNVPLEEAPSPND